VTETTNGNIDAPSATPSPPASSSVAPTPTLSSPVARRPGRLDPSTFRQTAIVAGIIAALFFGTQVIDDALPAAADQTALDVAPGNPVSIGEGWQITPAAGWQAKPHGDGQGIRLEKGVVAVDVFPQTFSSAGNLAQAYLDEVLKRDATQLTATDIEPVSENGGPAARFDYQGIFNQADGSIEGEVTSVVSGGSGVIADAWSPQGDLGEELAEVHAMVDTIEAAQ
jgi:hypothetical protein